MIVSRFLYCKQLSRKEEHVTSPKTAKTQHYHFLMLGVPLARPVTLATLPPNVAGDAYLAASWVTYGTHRPLLYGPKMDCLKWEALYVSSESFALWVCMGYVLYNVYGHVYVQHLCRTPLTKRIINGLLKNVLFFYCCECVAGSSFSLSVMQEVSTLLLYNLLPWTLTLPMSRLGAQPASDASYAIHL